MFDILETTFLWGLYVFVPLALITRHFGVQKAGLTLVAIFTFKTLVPLPQESKVNSIPNNTDITTVILASSREDGKGGETILASNKKNKKKFDLELDQKLEKHFPDWDGRMNYQKKQEECYKAAMKKQKELRKLRIQDKPTNYTKQELDAIAYFQGQGFYANEQNQKTKPNIYDTRQTFLFKMQDKTVRVRFLKSFKNLHR